MQYPDFNSLLIQVNVQYFLFIIAMNILKVIFIL